MSQQEKNTVEEKTSIFESIIWNPVTRFLGSLPFGLTILILLTASMAWATRIDALYGSQCSAWGFYRAGWFIALLAALAVSAFCAALNPKRWTKRKTGFMIIHSGVLVLLAGCAISLIWGWEADLTVYEGCQRNKAVSAQHVLNIRIFPKDPSSDFQKSNDAFEQNEKQPNIIDPQISCPIAPGPISWSQYKKLSWFPWGLVKPEPGLIYSGQGSGLNIKVRMLDFRKPYRELTVDQTLTLVVRPAQKSETAKNVSTSGDWTEITLQASRNIQEGLIGRSRLTGGQQVTYRRLTSEAQKQSFLNAPKSAVDKDVFTFVHAGKTYEFTLKDFLPEGKTIEDLRNGDDAPLPKVPLGDDVALTMINMEDAMGAAVFDVYKKDASGQYEVDGSMTLLCLLSEFNRNDPANDVYGEYFRPETSEQKADSTEENPMASMRAKLLGPRLELAMDSSRTMYYRTIVGKTVTTGEFAYTTPTLVFEGTPYAAVVQPRMDAPGVRYMETPLEEQKPSENDSAAALLSVECNGQTVERWVTLGVNNPMSPPEWYRNSDSWTIPVKNDKGESRWLTLTMPRKTVDLGFNLLLERFNRRLDPGTSMPSHYSSDVTALYPKNSNGESKKFEHVNIQLNQPVNFVNPNNGQSYRLYQSSFNGPLDKSGELAKWVAKNQTVKTNASAPLYSSTFTVNYDPGRGLLYLGCLMICAGIGAHYYLREPKKEKKSDAPTALQTSGVNSSTAGILLAVALSALLSSNALADDYSSLAPLPVLDSGRVEPLSTAAVEAVKSVCGTDSPQFSLDSAQLTGELSADSATRITRYFTDGGKTKKFSALELYMLWQMEPEVWEHIPFIECKNPDLRRLLGVPLVDKNGKALKYVSPRQASKSTILPDYRYNLELQIQTEQRAGIQHQQSKLEKSIIKLFDAVELYRKITFYPPASQNPRMASAPIVARLLQDQLAGWGMQLQAALSASTDDAVKQIPQTLSQYGETLRMIFLADENDQNAQRMDRSLGTITHLIDLYSSTLDKAIGALEKNAPLADQLQKAKTDLALIRYHLYDEGGLPGLVPSLNPDAVDLWRTPEDRLPVWLPITVLLYGDKTVLSGYPESKIESFRKAWDKAVKATAANNDKEQAAAFKELKSTLNDLGRYADSKRDALLTKDRLDNKVLDASRYPTTPKAEKLLQWEQTYYNTKPFNWSLIFSTLAMVACFALAFFPKRSKLAFAVPVTLLAIAVIYSGFGLGLRGYIMSRSPVANMFETIMFVSFMSGALGLVLPLALAHPERMRQAWNDSRLQFRCPLKRYWLLQIIRWVLAAILFYMMVFVSYGAGQGYAAVSLLPRLAYGATLSCVSDLLVWLSSLALLGIVVVYVPRTIIFPFMMTRQTVVSQPAPTGSVPNWKRGTPKTDCSETKPNPLARAASHRNSQLVPLLCASALTTLLTAAALHAPMFNDSLKNLMPILRDNFWLGVHVISIVGGYGTAMLAWALGAAALCAFTVGKYTTDESGAVVPPAITSTLSRLMYLCIPATIWLLAIGIILGGLWADVSWGRFWSWDRKEVWALISMFVYLIFVHARHWGWFKRNRDMTMALTSVFGALAILMAWYGVNYLLGSAMHGYASGSGGLVPALAFAGANVVLTVMALIRYGLVGKTER
ncbi:MAG: cytochrome c biogenesis protein CcsA [Thermoguttaceae bacterium]|nr:cytochrome c biogenesis protein CcsA [Thermoguttaceae bacterium]